MYPFSFLLINIKLYTINYVKKYHYKHIPKVITINKVLILSTFFFLFLSCASMFNKEPIEYKPVQYAKNDYRVLKKDSIRG